MDGTSRTVILGATLTYPTSLTIDYAKDHRLFWCDPKSNTIESILPNGLNRKIILADGGQPFTLDVFENWIYYETWKTGDLFVVDKFGQQPKHQLRAGLIESQALKMYHPVKYNVTAASSKFKIKGSIIFSIISLQSQVSSKYNPKI